MRSFLLKYDEKTEWLCAIGLYVLRDSNFDGNIVGIPINDIENYSADELFERVHFFKKHTEALKLYDLIDSYGMDVDECQSIEALNNHIDLALKVKSYGLGEEYKIDIDKFIVRCEIQIEKLENLIKRKIEQDKKKESRKLENGFIYVLKSDFGYKIGKTRRPEKRFAHFGVKLPFEVVKIIEIEVVGYHELEMELHNKFKDKFINGEWFNLSEIDLENIKNYLKKYSK